MWTGDATGRNEVTEITQNAPASSQMRQFVSAAVRLLNRFKCLKKLKELKYLLEVFL